MTAPEICDMAGHGESPEELDGPGQLLWYRVRDIYHDFERQRITIEEARKKKGRAILDYNRDRAKIKDGAAAMKRMADLYASVEIACAAFRKDPTVEHGRAIIEAIHGI